MADYVAPEIVLNQPHSFFVDDCSLGAMVCESVLAVPPFHADNGHETCRRAVLGHVSMQNRFGRTEFCKTVGKRRYAFPAEQPKPDVTKKA
jgi:hypothetical protein